MIVAVKFTLHCFSCFTLLLVSYKSVGCTQVIEQYSAQNGEQVLELSRRSIHDLLAKIRWDRSLSRRKYERDKRLLLLYKRANIDDSEDGENKHAPDSYSDEDEGQEHAVIRRALSKKTDARYFGGRHGSKKTHIIHSLENVSPIMESDSAEKIGLETKSKVDTKLTHESRDGNSDDGNEKDEKEYEGTELPVLLKQFHTSWHGENNGLSKFSNQRHHTVEKVEDRKDRISRREPQSSAQRRIVNVETTDESSNGSGDAEDVKVSRKSDGTDTEGSGATTTEVAKSSGEAPNERVGATKETESQKDHTEEEEDQSSTNKLGNTKAINENIEATIVNADGKSKDKDLKAGKATAAETLQDTESAAERVVQDKTSAKEDTAETIKNTDKSATQKVESGDTNTTTSKGGAAAVEVKSDANDTSRSTQYRIIKHVSTFSPKSFSDMIVEDVMKNKGDNRRLPARNTDLEVVAQRLNNPGTQTIEFETMHQPVTGQRILPFLGNRQTSKDFQSLKQTASKTTEKYNKLIKPRHLHHHHHRHHHSHHIHSSTPISYEKKSYPNNYIINSSIITTGSIVDNNVLKRRLVIKPAPLKPRSLNISPFQTSVATNRRLIPAISDESVTQQPMPAGQPVLQRVFPVKSMTGTKGLDYMPIRDPGYVPARLSAHPFVPKPKPTIYDKILKSVATMGAKEGIKPMRPLDTSKATSFLNSYYRHVKELSNDPQYSNDPILSNNTNSPKLEEAANYTQPKQDITYNLLPRQDTPYNVLTNATSYGGGLGASYSINNIRYSSPMTADRRGIKSIKNANLKTMPRTKQPLMKCYKGHCLKARKYADVSGSKKDVLIGQLVPNMDPEDQGGGELDVAEINGAQLLEESAAVDGAENANENEEEAEEEKKDELKGKRDFSRYTNSDLLKAITTQVGNTGSDLTTNSDDVPEGEQEANGDEDEDNDDNGDNDDDDDDEELGSTKASSLQQSDENEDYEGETKVSPDAQSEKEDNDYEDSSDDDEIGDKPVSALSLIRMFINKKKDSSLERKSSASTLSDNGFDVGIDVGEKLLPVSNEEDSLVRDSDIAGHVTAQRVQEDHTPSNFENDETIASDEEDNTLADDEIHKVNVPDKGSHVYISNIPTSLLPRSDTRKEIKNMARRKSLPPSKPRVSNYVTDITLPTKGNSYISEPNVGYPVDNSDKYASGNDISDTGSYITLPMKERGYASEGITSMDATGVGLAHTRAEINNDMSLANNDNSKFGNIDDDVDNFGYPNEKSPYIIDYDEEKLEKFIKDEEDKDIRRIGTHHFSNPRTTTSKLGHRHASEEDGDSIFQNLTRYEQFTKLQDDLLYYYKQIDKVKLENDGKQRHSANRRNRHHSKLSGEEKKLVSKSKTTTKVNDNISKPLTKSNVLKHSSKTALIHNISKHLSESKPSVNANTEKQLGKDKMLLNDNISKHLSKTKTSVIDNISKHLSEMSINETTPMHLTKGKTPIRFTKGSRQANILKNDEKNGTIITKKGTSKIVSTKLNPTSMSTRKVKKHKEITSPLHPIIVTIDVTKNTTSVGDLRGVENRIISLGRTFLTLANQITRRQSGAGAVSEKEKQKTTSSPTRYENNVQRTKGVVVNTNITRVNKSHSSHSSVTGSKRGSSVRMNIVGKHVKKVKEKQTQALGDTGASIINSLVGLKVALAPLNEIDAAVLSRSGKGMQNNTALMTINMTPLNETDVNKNSTGVTNAEKKNIYVPTFPLANHINGILSATKEITPPNFFSSNRRNGSVNDKIPEEIASLITDIEAAGNSKQGTNEQEKGNKNISPHQKDISSNHITQSFTQPEHKSVHTLSYVKEKDVEHTFATNSSDLEGGYAYSTIKHLLKSTHPTERYQHNRHGLSKPTSVTSAVLLFAVDKKKKGRTHGNLTSVDIPSINDISSIPSKGLMEVAHKGEGQIYKWKNKIFISPNLLQSFIKSNNLCGKKLIFGAEKAACSNGKLFGVDNQKSAKYFGKSVNENTLKGEEKIDSEKKYHSDDLIDKLGINGWTVIPPPALKYSLAAVNHPISLSKRRPKYPVRKDKQPVKESVKEIKEPALKYKKPTLEGKMGTVRNNEPVSVVKRPMPSLKAKEPADKEDMENNTDNADISVWKDLAVLAKDVGLSTWNNSEYGAGGSDGKKHKKESQYRGMSLWKEFINLANKVSDEQNITQALSSQVEEIMKNPIPQKYSKEGSFLTKENVPLPSPRGNLSFNNGATNKVHDNSLSHKNKIGTGETMMNKEHKSKAGTGETTGTKEGYTNAKINMTDILNNKLLNESVDNAVANKSAFGMEEKELYNLQKMVDSIEATSSMIADVFGKESDQQDIGITKQEVSTTKAPVTQTTTPTTTTKEATTSTKAAPTIDPEVMKFKEILNKKVEEMVEEFAMEKAASKNTTDTQHGISILGKGIRKGDTTTEGTIRSSNVTVFEDGDLEQALANKIGVGNTNSTEFNKHDLTEGMAIVNGLRTGLTEFPTLKNISNIMKDIVTGGEPEETEKSYNPFADIG